MRKAFPNRELSRYIRANGQHDNTLHGAQAECLQPGSAAAFRANSHDSVPWIISIICAPVRAGVFEVRTVPVTHTRASRSAPGLNSGVRPAVGVSIIRVWAEMARHYAARPRSANARGAR